MIRSVPFRRARRRPPRAVLAAAMAVTALACGASGTQPPVATRSMADSADQVATTVQLNIADHGLRRATLAADSAFWFDDNTRVVMRTIRITFFTEMGQQSSVLTARDGTSNARTNVMEAFGNVRVVGEGGKVLTTEHIRYDQGADRISSDSAFVFDQPGRRLTGIGFVSDPALNNIRVLKNPGGGGTFTLPGQ